MIYIDYKYDAWGNHRVFGLNKEDEVEVLQDIYDENAPEFDVEYLKYKQLSESNPSVIVGISTISKRACTILKRDIMTP